MNGVERIAAERQRQIEQEGWSEEHDRQHLWGTLATAGALYALPARIREARIFDRTLRVLLWPWDESWWKPAALGPQVVEGRVRELEKAGALIAAEIDLLLADHARLEASVDRAGRGA